MRFAKGLTGTACWLMAIVPGMYLLSFLSARYLYLPSTLYYPILALTAVGYAVFLFLMYRLKGRICNFVHSCKEAKSADCMNGDQ